VTDLLHDRYITRIETDDQLTAFAPALSSPHQPQDAAAGVDTSSEQRQQPAAGGDGDGEAAAALARVLLFTDKPKTTVLAKALSVGLAGRLVFGQVVRGVGGSEAVAARLGVEEYPTLLVIKVGGRAGGWVGLGWF